MSGMNRTPLNLDDRRTQAVVMTGAIGVISLVILIGSFADRSVGTFAGVCAFLSLVLGVVTLLRINKAEPGRKAVSPKLVIVMVVCFALAAMFGTLGASGMAGLALLAATCTAYVNLLNYSKSHTA